MPLTQAELDKQVVLTRCIGREASYQLKEVNRGRFRIDEDNFKKLSNLGVVTRTGRIYLADPNQALRVLGLLGTRMYLYKDNTVRRSVGAKSDKKNFKYGGDPKKTVNIRVTWNLNIKDSISDLILLRKYIWHEIMETALLGINYKVFGNPENVTLLSVPGGDNFAHLYVEIYTKIDRNTGADLSTQYNYMFHPWADDSPESTHPRTEYYSASRIPDKPQMFCNVTSTPAKKIAIEYNSGDKPFRGRVLNYEFYTLKDLNGPAGHHTIYWGEGAEPGTYWIDAIFDGETLRQEVEIIFDRPLIRWEAKADRDGYLIKPKNNSKWILGNGLGFTLYKNKDRDKGPVIPWSHYETLRLRSWSRMEAFGKYKICALAENPYLDVLFREGKLIEPKSLEVSYAQCEITSHGKYVRITYRWWPERFNCIIYDVSGNLLRSYGQPAGEGMIEWGNSANIKSGLYFINVKLFGYKYKVEKVVIAK